MNRTARVGSVIASATLMLSGCASGVTPAMVEYSQDQQCRMSSGEPGTEKYLQCRATLKRAQDAQAAQDCGAFWQKVGKLGETMQQAQRNLDGDQTPVQPVPSVAPPATLPPKPVNCVTRWVPGSPLLPGSGSWQSVCQ